jgi:hypothetical protein
MNNMKHTFVSFVKLKEQPTRENGYFVVVEGNAGLTHYVSKLFGAAAKGLKAGTKMKLLKTDAKQFTAYTLERV